ncbi:MAG: stage II sporulation protein M [Methanosarcinaceae archaeon]|nr:stage II sporulation protein M [Methanosarcinaceae archaeon]
MSIMEGIYNEEVEGNYFRSIQPQLLVVVLLFVLSTVAGYIYSSMNPGSAEQLMEEMGGIVDIIKDMSPIGIMLFIFFNNAVKSLIAILLGAGFGLLPILFVTFNGYMIGVVSYVVASEKGFAYVISAILPHGIIELPMILISAAIGFRIGYETYCSVIGRQSNIKQEFMRGVKFYFHWIMPLLFVAAVIETFITPLVILMIS